MTFGCGYDVLIIDRRTLGSAEDLLETRWSSSPTSVTLPPTLPAVLPPPFGGEDELCLIREAESPNPPPGPTFLLGLFGLKFFGFLSLWASVPGVTGFLFI